MVRRLTSLVAALIATLLVALSILTYWAYNETFSTDRFVSTAESISSSPIVQQEMSEAIIESLFPDVQLPPRLLTPLTRVVTTVVNSDSFQLFWSDAVRSVHEPVIDLLTSNEPITSTTKADIDLSPLISNALTAIRSAVPALGPLLPREVPSQPFTLFDTETLRTARSLTQIAQIARWLLPLLSAAFIALAVALRGREKRSFQPVGVIIFFGAIVCFIIGVALPSTMSSVVDAQHSDITRNVASHIAHSLVMRSAMLAVIGLALFGLVAFYERRKIQASGNT